MSFTPENVKSPYLRGWKEIANYLKSSTRTVQRWERIGLPVHRVDSTHSGGVFALVHEVDAWMVREMPASPQASRVQPVNHYRAA